MNDTRDLLPLQAAVFQSEPDGEHGVAPLYTRLRKMILDGVFPPGSMLSQVKLAESLGVSRIPLREALRMLQKEGLIEAEHNQRARVPSFEPSVVDSLYASRILLEALSIRLTVPRIEQADVQALKHTLTELDEAAAHIDLDVWEKPHRRFHALLVLHAEDSMRQTIAGYTDRCEYYRRLYYRLVSTHQPTRPAEVTALASLITAADAGVDILTHAPLDADVDDTLARSLARRGIVSVPTLIAMRTVAGIAEMAAHRKAQGMDVDYAHSRQSVTAFHRAGITVLAGTDAYQGPAAPASIQHGEAFHDELGLLVEAGLTPVEALRSATVLPAQYFGFTDRGVIAPGRRADLLLIKGDPTQDIAATRAIRSVWVAGVQVR